MRPVENKSVLFYHLYEEIYGEHVSTKNKVSVWDYYQSWKLRGDQPAFYRLEEEEFLKQLTRKQIQRFDRYGWNHKAGSHIRKTECARNLYFAYHYNQIVRETGDEKTILFGLTGTGYFDLVAYEKFHNGVMIDNIPADEDIAQSLAKLPKI